MSELTAHCGESPFDEIREVRDDGTEFWSARDLMPLLGYERWENFVQAIDRAKIAVEVQGNSTEDNFRDTTKVTDTRGPNQRDFELTRFAAYQVAMSGDPRKPEVAAALAYFAIRAREAETAQDARFQIPATYADALRAAAEQAELAEKEHARAVAAEHRIELQAPKVAKADAHSASRQWIGRQVFAREVQKWGRQWGYNIMQEDVYELLRRKGMLIRGNRADRNHATAQAEKAGWATVEKGVDEDNGHAWVKTRISPKGQDVAWKWVSHAVVEHGDNLNPPKDIAA